MKRNLAFYKRSRTPWTLEEFKKIQEYVGDTCTWNIPPTMEYVFDSGEHEEPHMYDWVQVDEDYDDYCQYDHHNFFECKQVVYEDIFPL